MKCGRPFLPAITVEGGELFKEAVEDVNSRVWQVEHDLCGFKIVVCDLCDAERLWGLDMDGPGQTWQLPITDFFLSASPAQIRNDTAPPSNTTRENPPPLRQRSIVDFFPRSSTDCLQNRRAR